MFAKTLKVVLAEYRKKYAPWTPINDADLSEAVGYLSAKAAPDIPKAPLTPQQKACDRMAKAVRRAQRLIRAIETHEKV